MACSRIHSRIRHRISSRNWNCWAPLTNDAGHWELSSLSGTAGADEHYKHNITDGQSAEGFGFQTGSTAGSFVEATGEGGTGFPNAMLLHLPTPCPCSGASVTLHLEC